MDKEDIAVCTDVLGLFDLFEYKGTVSSMVKSTQTLQSFARMLGKHKEELKKHEITVLGRTGPEDEKKEEPKKD
jgi:hypothetical protein